MYLLDDNSLAQRQIGHSEFTVRWLLDNLEKKDAQWRAKSNRTTIRNILVKDIGEGIGYVSKVYQIIIEFADENLGSYSVVLKVPMSGKISTLVTKTDQPDGGGNNNIFDKIVGIAHAKECQFYSSYKEDLIAIPKVFVTQELIPGKQDGAILMEYVANGARCASLFETFTMPQIEKLARQIAHLQAFSATLSDDMLGRFAVREEALPIILQIYASRSQETINLAPDMRPLFKRIEHLTKSLEFVKYSIKGIHEELGIRPVLVHGDFHFNNVFWKTNDDGSCSSDPRAIIDWQAIHPGNPGEDLARVLMFCTDPATRREAEDRIFDVYYEALREELDAKKIAIPFTKEKVIVCYKRAFIMQFFFALSLLKVLLDDHERSAKDESRVYQAKLEMVLLRIRLGLKDAVEIVENEMLQWANSS